MKFYYCDFYFDPVLLKASSTIPLSECSQTLGESGQNYSHVEAEASSYTIEVIDLSGRPITSRLANSGLGYIG